MINTEVINYLIQKNNYKSYLEIGSETGLNFYNVQIENKECCDITDSNWQLNTPITYLMSSDEMFEKMPIDKKYDIIFIDGMHSEEYLDRDIINSLKHLNKGGLILCHDVLPKCYLNTTELNNQTLWTGDCWKSITKLQDQNISFHTLNQYNFGLTIIHYVDNPYSLHYPYYKCNIKYSYVFNENNFNEIIEENYTEQGKYILHIISEEEFFKLY